MSVHKVELKIIEHPNKYHFRSESELKGKHGVLEGLSTTATKKTYPTVRLLNYTGKALIRCLLYQVEKQGEDPMFHPHTLYRCNDKKLTDPNNVTVILPMNGNYEAAFEGIGIIAIIKKFRKEYLEKKLIDDEKYKLNRKLTPDEEKAIKSKANTNSVDINAARLCFDAYCQNAKGEWLPICEPSFSSPFGNKSLYE